MKQQRMFPIPFSRSVLLIDGMTIRSTDEVVSLEGSMDVNADQGGLEQAKEWDQWWAKVILAISEKGSKSDRVTWEQGGGKNETELHPFSNISGGIDELIIDGAVDQVAMYGHLSVPHTLDGFKRATFMAKIFQSIVVDLEGRQKISQLPDQRRVDAPVIKSNPLG